MFSLCIVPCSELAPSSTVLSLTNACIQVSTLTASHLLGHQCYQGPPPRAWQPDSVRELAQGAASATWFSARQPRVPVFPTPLLLLEYLSQVSFPIPQQRDIWVSPTCPQSAGLWGGGALDLNSEHHIHHHTQLCHILIKGFPATTAPCKLVMCADVQAVVKISEGRGTGTQIVPQPYAIWPPALVLNRPGGAMRLSHSQHPVIVGLS